MENENVKTLISKQVNAYYNLIETGLAIGGISYEKLMLFIANLYEVYGLSPINHYGKLLFSCTKYGVLLEFDNCIGGLSYHYTYYEDTGYEEEYLSQSSGNDNATIEEKIKAVEDEAKFVQIVKALKVLIQVHIKGNITL